MNKINLILWGVGIAVGAVGGYLYWYYIGCLRGSCPITSSPVNSSLYGALMGGLLLNIFTPSKTNQTSITKEADKAERNK